MLGEDRDATLTHIIHELRDYKKRLVEQIDASRARGGTTHGGSQPVPADGAAGHPLTPPAPAACPAPPTSHISGPLGAATKLPPPLPLGPRKELPDLVRSSIPPVVTTASGARPAAIWNPALSVSYTVDSYGALDLSTRDTRPATITSPSYPPPPPPPTPSSETVLDLSCRRRWPSHSPPPVTTSSVRPEAESAASRGRRHNRKSSSASSGAVATGRHDDHDNPLLWSVRDVIEFVSEVPGCQAYAEVLAYLIIYFCCR